MYILIYRGFRNTFDCTKTVCVCSLCTVHAVVNNWSYYTIVSIRDISGTTKIKGLSFERKFLM